MARGQPGQAGTYDPKKGGKVKPSTKAEPFGGEQHKKPHEGHGHKGKGQGT